MGADDGCVLTFFIEMFGELKTATSQFLFLNFTAFSIGWDNIEMDTPFLNGAVFGIATKEMPDLRSETPHSVFYLYLCRKVCSPTMKKGILILAVLLSLIAGLDAGAQPLHRGYLLQEWMVVDGDSIPLIHIAPIYVFDRPVDLRRHRKLVEAVKRVYPVAQLARRKMADMEEELLRLPDKKSQKAFIKRIYSEIKEEYTPVLKKMTRTQGKVLLKLIDRETDYTAYEILKEFRGGFVAGFWQGISRIFGQNLKSEYDRDGQDRVIEQIIVYYEAGLL